MWPSVLSFVCLFVSVLLFNDGHVLQLRPETLTVHRRMGNGLDDYDGQIISRNKYGLNFLTFILQLRENSGKTSTRKLAWPGFEPGPTGRETTLPLNHSHLAATTSVNLGSPELSCHRFTFTINLVASIMKKWCLVQGFWTFCNDLSCVQRLNEIWMSVNYPTKVCVFDW